MPFTPTASSEPGGESTIHMSDPTTASAPEQAIHQDPVTIPEKLRKFALINSLGGTQSIEREIRLHKRLSAENNNYRTATEGKPVVALSESGANEDDGFFAAVIERISSAPYKALPNPSFGQSSKTSTGTQHPVIPS